jgi:hypothetical protein
MWLSVHWVIFHFHRHLTFIPEIKKVCFKDHANTLQIIKEGVGNGKQNCTSEVEPQGSATQVAQMKSGQPDAWLTWPNRYQPTSACCTSLCSQYEAYCSAFSGNKATNRPEVELSSPSSVPPLATPQHFVFHSHVRRNHLCVFLVFK